MSTKHAFHLIGKRYPACHTKRKIHEFVHLNPGLTGINIAKKIKLTKAGVYPHLNRLVTQGKLRVEKDPNTNAGKLYYSITEPEPNILDRVRPTQCFGENNLLLSNKPLVLTNNGEDLGYYIPKDLLPMLGLDEQSLSEVSDA